MPAITDSHGKPGIAGSTIGVETDIVVELLVDVGVLTTVIVDTDVLTTVVVSELVVIVDVEALDEVELVIDEDDEGTVVVATELELEVLCVLLCVVLCVLVACWPTTGGLAGSRWKIPASGVVA